MDKYTVQCSLVGDAMIGKSSLAKAITGQNFDEGYIATTEDSYSTSLSVAGDKYSLSILDLSGQVNRLFFKILNITLFTWYSTFENVHFKLYWFCIITFLAFLLFLAWLRSSQNAGIQKQRYLCRLLQRRGSGVHGERAWFLGPRDPAGGQKTTCCPCGHPDRPQTGGVWPHHQGRGTEPC